MPKGIKIFTGIAANTTPKDEVEEVPISETFSEPFDLEEAKGI